MVALVFNLCLETAASGVSEALNPRGFLNVLEDPWIIFILTLYLLNGSPVFRNTSPLCLIFTSFGVPTDWQSLQTSRTELSKRMSPGFPDPSTSVFKVTHSFDKT